MLIDPHHAVIHIPHRELLTLQIRDRVTVRCLEGQLWITQHHDAADILLGPGQTVELTRPGTAVVQALRPARLAFAPAVASSRVQASTVECRSIRLPSLLSVGWLREERAQAAS